MENHRLIRVERRGRVSCVRLINTRLEELDIYEFGEEMLSLAEGEGSPFLALSLGPQTPRCLFSVFLSRLVALRNAFRSRGGELVLCEVGPLTYSAFTACHLHGEFVFLPDFDAAVGFFEARAEEVRPA